MAAKTTNSKPSVKGTSKNPTVAEMKENYARLESQLKQFAEDEKIINKLTDLTKTRTKTITAFDKDTLRSYLQNLGANEANMRNVSWYLYYRSQVYARLCNFYANMFDLNARSVIPGFDMVKGGDANKMLKSYQDTLNALETLRLQQEMYNVYLTCFIQDVFYGVVFYDETGLFIYPFPADYARISGKYPTGDFSYAIDCSYFRKYPELLEWYPEPFQTLFNQYESDGLKWQEMPQEYAMCMKFRSEDFQTVLCPFAPVLNSFINLIDLEDIQAIANEQSIYKMIWLEMETIDGSDRPNDWKVNPTLSIKYFNRMLNEALPEYISAAIVPGKLNEISFPDDQASDTKKVADATQTVLNTAGGAEILNGSTINNTYAFKLACIQNTEYAISSLLPQTQSWVNRFLALQLGNPAKVKFFPISVYTKEDFKKEMLSSAQNGLPTKLAYNTLNGFSELETMSLNFLEEEVLHLADKFVPLSTSYTQSGNGDSTDKAYDPEPSGAPTKDAGDLTDSGEKSRNQ